MDKILNNNASINRFFMTKEEFQNQAVDLMDHSGSTLYLEATDKFVSALEELLKTSPDPEHLKSSLSNLCKDRRDFLEFAIAYPI